MPGLCLCGIFEGGSSVQPFLKRATHWRQEPKGLGLR